MATQTIAPAGPAPQESGESLPAILVENVDIAYGDFVIQQHLDFAVRRGEIFVIMGGSGCGKTTVMRAMVGLKAPARGRIVIDGIGFWEAAPPRCASASRAASASSTRAAPLWSSMTLAENVALPLGEYTGTLSRAEIQDVVALWLALVGLAGFEDYYPSEISGGMRKRAGGGTRAGTRSRASCSSTSLRRASIRSPLRSLDDLIVELRDSLGTTMVMVTHELPSIFAIADNGVDPDAETKTQARDRRSQGPTARRRPIRKILRLPYRRRQQWPPEPMAASRCDRGGWRRGRPVRRLASDSWASRPESFGRRRASSGRATDAGAGILSVRMWVYRRRVIHTSARARRRSATTR